ncbi:MAG: DUF1929 domain-containing protein [Akkermansiaceae bacterium]|nr:DUF1929 domain-containing protein [Akkermansiaceae bacterium]
MNGSTLSRSLSATAAVALLAAPCLHADFDHAAEDEFAAAAAALAPKFDPERDGITIEKILAQQAAAAKAASGKQSAKKGMKKPKKETAKSKGGKKKDKGGNKKNNKPKKPKKPAKTKKPAAGNTAKTTIVTGNGPDARGTWGPVISWTPHIPVTASVLPNGKLLTFASNQRTTFPSGPEFTYAAVWDPATGQFTEVNNTRHDMFCGGTALLPDGRLVINGGRATTRLSSVFDWQANQWNALPNMNDPRWYNPSVALPDGGVFTVSGSGGSNTAERWDPATGWRRLSGIGWSAVTSQPGYINIWHPFLMVAPNGNLFHFGPTDRMNWVTTSGSGSLAYSGNNVPGSHYPKEGAWAMYDEGRILVTGGGANTTSGSDSTTGTSTTSTYKVDLRGTNPVVTSIAPMTIARQFANSVVLPNGEVMVVGGNGGVKFSDAASVLTPEIWNPETETWRTVSNHSIPRNYHSVALLLPDGRVWSGGGGLGGNAADHRDAQIFTPPMLYTSSGALANRPVIQSMPPVVGVGTTFTVSATPGVERFTMIRMSAVTHSVNTDQRFVEASFSETSPGVYQVNARSNVNVLLPGYWMLFAIDSAGVHSVSKMFQVDPTSVVTLSNPGNQAGYAGEEVSLVPTAGGPAGSVLSFTATGLPGGLTIDPATGRITGTPAATGNFTVSLGVTDGVTSATQTFTWTLAPLSRSHKFANFPSAAGLVLNGNAAVTSSLLRLTTATTNQAGSAWLGQSFPVRGDTSFATRFVFRQTGAADGADGLVFVVQGLSSDVLGTGGGSLGYGGIGSSLAVEFDSYAGGGDPNANHIGVLTNGNVTTHLATHSPGFDMEDGAGHTAWVEYDGPANTLRVYLSEAVTQVRPATPVITLGAVDLAALAGRQAWFGFTAATGGSVNAHEILSWDMAMDANHLPGLSEPPVPVDPGPLVSVKGSAVAIQFSATDPDNDPLTFTATNLPAGLSISAGGLVAGIPTSTGSRLVTLGVSDGINDPVTVSFTWTINDPFELTPLAGPPIGSGAAGAFTASSTGGNNVLYQWDFGDGSPATGFSTSPVANHTYTTPGRYVVTLTATDDTGRTLTSSFHQGVSAPLTVRAPSASSSIALERRSGGNPRIWVVNPDAGSVAVIDSFTRAKIAEITVGASPRSVAVAPDGRVWVACADATSVSIISPTSLAVVGNLPMPRGSRPFGIAFDPAGTAGWLTLEATGRLLKLDPADGSIVSGTAVGPNPRHLSIAHDGSRILVSRFITPLLPGEDTATIDSTGKGGEVVVVNGADGSIETTVILHHSEQPDTSLSGRGIPNYLGAPVITPDGLSAWIPSKQDNIKRGMLRDGNPLTHDSAVRPIASRVDLTNLAEDHPARIDFNDAGTPTAVCHDPAGIYTFVALEGSRAVAVVDTWNHREITRFDAGRAPQGLVLSDDGGTLFVQNFMDRSVTFHDVSDILAGGTNPPALAATVSTVANEPLAPDVLLGKKHFYDTRDNRLALQEYISCASCHADGGQDGRVWDFTGFGEGLRNTITLHGQAGQGALHWSGNFDEIQDFEGQIRGFAGGLGLITNGAPHPPMGTPNAGRSPDLDALAAYLNSLTATDDSPARTKAETLPADALAGRSLFKAMDCASCHGGDEFTLSAPGVFRDVGTIKPSTGQRLGGELTGLDIPTLRGLWATAPYLHDGSAASIEDAIAAHSGVSLTGDDLSNLATYIRNLDETQATVPAPLSVVLSTSAVDPTSGFTVDIAFSAPPSGFGLSDIVVTNGNASALTGDGTGFRVTVTPAGPGALTVSLPAGACADSDGDPNLASNLLVTEVPPTGDGFAETFDGGALDTAKWTIGTPYGEMFAPAKPEIAISVAGGRLGISPLAATPVEGYNGVVSRATIDLRGSAVEARVDPAGGTADSWLALGAGNGNFLAIGREGGILWIEQMTGGGRDVIVHDFDPSEHLIWRIEHDETSDSILYQLSRDGSAWTTVRTVARAIDISAMRIELGAGTFRWEAAPGTAWFDYVAVDNAVIAPSISSFTATPRQITAGASTTLGWSADAGGAPLTSLTLNGQNVLGTNEFIVSPAETTTYTLTATSSAGSATASTVVTVLPSGGGLTYDAWVNAFGAAGSVSADGDGDSYPEGLEYALGLDPSGGSATRSTLPGADPSVNRSVRLERAVAAGGVRRFDLVFTRPVSPLPDIGYGYWLEYSEDMENWAISANLNGAGSSGIPDILDILVTDLGDGTEEVRAGFKSIPRFFVRLAVYLPGGIVRSAPFGWMNRQVHFGENLIAPPFARESVFGGNYSTVSSVFTDAAASWTANEWQGHFVHITSGAAEGTMLRISSNTGNTLAFAGESAGLLARLTSAPSGRYVIRSCHTIGGLFGDDNRDGLVAGDASASDLVELPNPDSSFSVHHFDGNWKPVDAPAVDSTDRIVPPTDAVFLRRRAFLNSEVHLFGEVVLGTRVAPIRSGISLPGTWNAIETDNIDSLGVDSMFTSSPTAVMDSNIYLEIGTGGGLYPHYLKTGTGWRFVQGDSTPAGSGPFAAAQSWYFIRFGPELLWIRGQPFAYAP